MTEKRIDNRGRLIKLISIFLFYCMIFNHNFSKAQGININNPVEISQPWVSEINPAIISSQYSRISLGLKIFHFGFLPDQSFEIRESHINASFPFYLPYEIGIGGDLRYFSAGIYSEISSALMLSRKLVKNLAVGVKLGIGRLDFAKQNFKLVNQDDPLLTGSLAKTSFNVGVGAFWNYDRWSVGLGIDHINQPDIGRQTRAILPQALSIAIGYKFGSIQPDLLLQHDGNFARYGLAISYQHERFGLLRFSYQNTMPIKMEVQFNISRDNSIQYGFDLPAEELNTVSMGSHEIVFNRILGRGPDIGQPKILLSIDTMRIQEEKIVRSMSPGLMAWQLENINELVPEYLATNENYRNLLIIPTGALNQYETEKIRKQRYANLGEEIKQKLQTHPELNLILQTDDQSLADARMLKNYLIREGICKAQNMGVAKITSSGKAKLVGFEPGKENESLPKPSCSVDRLLVSFELPGKIRHVKSWEMTIKNNKDEVVRTFQGKNELPDFMEWDWKNEWGEFVPAGQYICALNVKSMSGQERLSSSTPIKISRLNRTIYLRFSKESNLQASKIEP